jgi:hypothetical protein
MMRSPARTFLFAVLLPSTAFAQYEHCTTIINEGLRSYNLINHEFSQLDATFSRYCERSGETRERSNSRSLEAVVKTIPVRFTGQANDHQTAMRNFCRQFSTLATTSSRYTQYQENIVERAYDSFDRCVASADDQVKLYHSVRDTRDIDFFIQPSLGRVITVNGIGHSANTICTAITPQSGGREVTLTRGSQISLAAGQTLNIGCVRRPDISDDGVQRFEESTIVVYTDTRVGNYGAQMPRDERLPENRAILLNERVRTCEASSVALGHSVNLLTRRLAGIQSTGDIFYVGEHGGRGRNHFPCYTAPQAAADRLCRARLPGSSATARLLGSTSGNRCGYASYVVSCVRVPES